MSKMAIVMIQASSDIDLRGVTWINIILLLEKKDSIQL